MITIFLTVTCLATLIAKSGATCPGMNDTSHRSLALLCYQLLRKFYTDLYNCQTNGDQSSNDTPLLYDRFISSLQKIPTPVKDDDNFRNIIHLYFLNLRNLYLVPSQFLPIVFLKIGSLQSL